MWDTAAVIEKDTDWQDYLAPDIRKEELIEIYWQEVGSLVWENVQKYEKVMLPSETIDLNTN